MTKRISALLAILLAVCMILPQTTVFAATKNQSQTTSITAVKTAEKSAIEIWAEEKYGAIRESLEFDSDADMLGGKTLEEFRTSIANQKTAYPYWKANGLPSKDGWTDKMAWAIYYLSYYYNKVVEIGKPFTPLGFEHQKLTALFCIYDEELSYKESFRVFANTSDTSTVSVIYLIARSESGNLYVSREIAEAYWEEKGYNVTTTVENGIKGFWLQQLNITGRTYELSKDVFPTGNDPAIIQMGSVVLYRWDTILEAADTLYWHTMPNFRDSGL